MLQYFLTEVLIDVREFKCRVVAQFLNECCEGVQSTMAILHLGKRVTKAPRSMLRKLLYCLGQRLDGERAIVVLRDAVAKFHGGRIIQEAPAKGESQSNGVIEEAGKSVR